MRHLHPQEIALFSGLKPSHVTPDVAAFHLRLEMAGVGQLATPLQGGWVLSNLLYRTAAPREIFAKMCAELLDERDHMWPNGNTPYMQLFEQEIKALDRPWIFSNLEQMSEQGTEDDAHVDTKVLPCTVPCTVPSSDSCTGRESSVTALAVYIDPVDASQETPQPPAEYRTPALDVQPSSQAETPQLPDQIPDMFTLPSSPAMMLSNLKVDI